MMVSRVQGIVYHYSTKKKKISQQKFPLPTAGGIFVD